MKHHSLSSKEFSGWTFYFWAKWKRRHGSHESCKYHNLSEPPICCEVLKFQHYVRCQSSSGECWPGRAANCIMWKMLDQDHPRSRSKIIKVSLDKKKMLECWTLECHETRMKLDFLRRHHPFFWSLIKFAASVVAWSTEDQPVGGGSSRPPWKRRRCGTICRCSLRPRARPSEPGRGDRCTMCSHPGEGPLPVKRQPVSSYKPMFVIRCGATTDG